MMPGGRFGIGKGRLTALERKGCCMKKQKRYADSGAKGNLRRRKGLQLDHNRKMTFESSRKKN